MTDPRIQQLASEAAQKIKADAIAGISDSLTASADSQSQSKQTY